MSLVQKVEQEPSTSPGECAAGGGVLRQIQECLSIVLAGPVLVVSALALTASLMSTSVIRKPVAIQPFGADSRCRTVIPSSSSARPSPFCTTTFQYQGPMERHDRGRTQSEVLSGKAWAGASPRSSSPSTEYAAISFELRDPHPVHDVAVRAAGSSCSWGAKYRSITRNPQFLSLAPAAEIPNARLIERTVVSVMFLVALHFFRGLPAWTTGGLAERLGADFTEIDNAVAALRRQGLIIQTGDDPPGWLPARDLDTILLQDVFAAVRLPGNEEPAPSRARHPPEPPEKLVTEIDRAIGSALNSRTIKDLVNSSGEQEQRAA